MRTFLPNNFIKSFNNSRYLQFIVCTLTVFFIMIIIILTNVTETLENKSLDYRFRHAHNPQLVDTNIILIAIDDNSLAYYENNGISWPWPREFYGLMLNFFKRAGAKTVGFDIIFTQKDISSTDEYFADAINKFKNAIIATQLNVQIGLEYNPLIPTKLLTLPTPNFYVKNYNNVIAPLQIFQTNCKYLGVVDFKEDKDGIARRTELIYQYKNKYLLNFAAALYCAGNNIKPEDFINYLAKIDKTSDSKFFYFWYGKGGPDDGVFRYYTAAAIIQSEIALMNNQTPILSPEIFKDKFIIVGGTSAGLHDFKPTPFTYLENYPGMEIHATMLSNLNKKHHIKIVNVFVEILILFIIILLATHLYFYSKKVIYSLIFNIFLGVGYLLLSLLLFKYYFLWIPLINIEISIILSFSISAYISYITERQKKKYLKEAMSKYLSPVVVDLIVKDPSKIELGGDEYEGTVFFSDIKNFTTISEQYEPKELISYLNNYLTDCTNIILANNGMLDKFIGDAIMAIFGAPIKTGNHALQACISALDIHNKITLVNLQFNQQDKPTFITRIGLNTGSFILGNVGNTNRLEYTAIGDTVNLASRLEGVNKEFGTNIIISESTYNLAKDFIIARELDFIKVKGKSKPIRIYELIALKEDNNFNYKYIDFFQNALNEYRKTNFDKATLLFNEVLKIKHNDGPSLTYLNRIEILIQNGVEDNWDGVYEMKTK